LSVTSTANSGDQFPVGQTTPVTYYATDGSGNTSSCTFTVTVNGNCITNPSDLLISYFDPPQAWNLNESLDVIIDLTNVGGQTASGTKQFLLTAMNGWTYTWNPSQTESETIFGDIVPVQNNAWVIQPVFVGPLFVGLQFSTNEVMSPNEVVNLAIQVKAPGVPTSRFLNSSIQAGSGGDTNSGNNLARINVVSQ
jgi:hypothetical protein